MATTRIKVEARVIQWARLSSGLDEVTAARKLSVSVDTLLQWEAGELAPTLVQLRRAAKVYGRPLAVLLLSHPPNEQGFDALRDFRTSARRPERTSPELLAEVRRAHAQRDVLLELFEISPDSVPEPRPIPSLSTFLSDADESGAVLREFLGINLEDQLRTSTANAALNLWIRSVETAGVLVLQTRGVERSEMHGFSISEWPFPVAALNGSDWPHRKIFTLLHELAHVALNLGGICDLHESRTIAGRPRGQTNEIEHLCNSIAASALLPAPALRADPLVRGRSIEHRWMLDELQALSRKYEVSSEAVLLRLIGLSAATWDTYWMRKPELDALYEAAREQEQRRNRESSGGPSYYVLKARNLGHAYTASVIDAYRSDRISSLDVADFLGIRFSQLPAIEAVV